MVGMPLSEQKGDEMGERTIREKGSLDSGDTQPAEPKKQLSCFETQVLNRANRIASPTDPL